MNFEDIIKKGNGVWNEWKRENGYTSKYLDIDNIILIDYNLRNYDFSNMEIFNSDFSKSDLSGSDFHGSIIKNCKFKESILDETDFYGATLENVVFSSSSLNNANFCESTIIKCKLNKSNLFRVQLNDASIEDTDFSDSCLIQSNLNHLDAINNKFNKANLSDSSIYDSRISGIFNSTIIINSVLMMTYFSDSNFIKVRLNDTNLNESHFQDCSFNDSDLTMVDFKNAKILNVMFKKCYMNNINFFCADLSGSQFINSSMDFVQLSNSIVDDTSFINCSVYGAAIWNLQGRTKQESNIKITIPTSSNQISVDGIETAQFFNMIVENAKISKMLDVASSKVVLILGRFTPERKKILDALKKLLLSSDYIPILFDFDCPELKTTQETINILAGLSHYILADVTEATSTLQEIQSIVGDFPTITIIPIIEKGNRWPSMWDSFIPRHNIKAMYEYSDYKGLEKYIIDTLNIK